MSVSLQGLKEGTLYDYLKKNWELRSTRICKRDCQKAKFRYCEEWRDVEICQINRIVWLHGCMGGCLDGPTTPAFGGVWHAWCGLTSGFNPKESWQNVQRENQQKSFATKFKLVSRNFPINPRLWQSIPLEHPWGRGQQILFNPNQFTSFPTPKKQAFLKPVNRLRVLLFARSPNGWSRLLMKLLCRGMVTFRIERIVR